MRTPKNVKCEDNTFVNVRILCLSLSRSTHWPWHHQGICTLWQAHTSVCNIYDILLRLSVLIRNVQTIFYRTAEPQKRLNPISILSRRRDDTKKQTNKPGSPHPTDYSAVLLFCILLLHLLWPVLPLLLPGFLYEGHWGGGHLMTCYDFHTIWPLGCLVALGLSWTF